MHLRYRVSRDRLAVRFQLYYLIFDNSKPMITLHDKTFVPFISEQELDALISEMATKINADFAGKNPLFVAVLNGSFMFTSDLMKKITVDCELSFVKLASYNGTASAGVVNELIGLADNLNGRHVVVLEDIVDTGRTLEYLLEVLKIHELASLSIATLLLKPDVFDKKYKIHYVGKNIPNKFVVGFGLDYNELGRNLKAIYQLADA
jgi:hypoxanthine phosphoribosyltransferase